MLRAKVDADSKNSQQRHKLNQNRRMRETPPLHPHHLVSVARPRLTESKVPDASIIAAGNYNKMPGCSFGHFRAISVQVHIFTIDEDGKPNTLSIARVFRAPTMPKSTPLSHSRQIRTRLNAHSVLNVPITPSNRLNLSNISTVHKRGYTVDRIVRFIGSEPSLKYVVFWYGYTSMKTALNIEPPENIPQGIKTRYCQYS